MYCRRPVHCEGRHITPHCRHHRLFCVLLTSQASTITSAPSAVLSQTKRLPFSPIILSGGVETAKSHFQRKSGQSGTLTVAQRPKGQVRVADMLGFTCNRFSLPPSIKLPLVLQKHTMGKLTSLHIASTSECCEHWFCFSLSAVPFQCAGGRKRLPSGFLIEIKLNLKNTGYIEFHKWLYGFRTNNDELLHFEELMSKALKAVGWMLLD